MPKIGVKTTPRNKHTGIVHTHANNPPLPCGCIIGYVLCLKMEQLEAEERIAYQAGHATGDWKPYDKARKAVWEHLGEPYIGSK